MGNVARNWRCWAALGLALASRGAWADQILFNRSSQTVTLRVVEAKVSQGVLRVQVHLTGRTPRTATPTVVLDEVKGERKTFLSDQAGALAPREVVIAGDTPLASIPAMGIPPLGSARFIRVPVDLPRNDVNLVVFELLAVQPGPGLPVLRNLNLRVGYGLSTDFAGHATEVCFPQAIRQVDEKGAGIPPLLAFEERGPDDEHLVLIDPPKPGCGCCVM